MKARRDVVKARSNGGAQVPPTFLQRLEIRLAGLPKSGNGKHRPAPSPAAPRPAADPPARAADGGPPTKARILIVDGHPMVRDWMSKFLSDQGDLEVCGEATTAREAVEAVETLRPHLVVTELMIGKDFGIELIKDLKARWSSLPVLVLSTEDEAIYAERVLHAGALGFISKAAPPAEIARALRRVLAAQVYLSDAMTGLLLGRLAHSPVALPRTEIEQLSDREAEVFELIGQGKSSREIGLQLHIGTKTVESYKTRLKAKLHLDNARQLLQHAVRWILEA